MDAAPQGEPTDAPARNLPPACADLPAPDAAYVSGFLRTSAAKILLSAAVQAQRVKKSVDATAARAVTASGIATSGEITDLARRSARLARRIRHLAEALERASILKKP